MSNSKSLSCVRLVRVNPTRHGFAPVLAPGEGCKDHCHGIWHLRTPDGMLMSVGGRGSRTQVEESKRGLTVVPGPPAYAYDPQTHGVVANLWTVVREVWVKV